MKQSLVERYAEARIGLEIFSDLDFADVVALLAEMMVTLALLLEILDREAD